MFALGGKVCIRKGVRHMFKCREVSQGGRSGGGSYDKVAVGEESSARYSVDVCSQYS